MTETVLLGFLVIGMLLIAIFSALHLRGKQIDRLADDLEELRRRFESGRSEPNPKPEPEPKPTPQPNPKPKPKPQPTASSPAPASSPTSRTTDAASLEQLLGGRVLLVIGVVAVLAALGFFLKIAVERGWLPPAARIALGATSGVLLLVGGDRLRGRGLAAYGHALMGLGLGALFLCVHFAALRYGMIERGTAFVLCFVLTAIGAVLAIVRDAPLLAWLGFFGGFVAPALLGQDVDALEQLTLWLGLLDLGLLGFLLVRRAEALIVMPALASSIYLGAWIGRFLNDSRRDVAGACLLVHLLLLLALGLLPALRRRASVAGPTLFVLALSGAALAFMGFGVLYDARPHALGSGLVLVAALLAATAIVREKARATTARLAVDVDVPDATWLALLAFATLSAALPTFFEGRALAPAWSLLGLAGVALARAPQRGLLAAGGLLLLTVAALRGALMHAVARRAGVDGVVDFVPLLDRTTLSALAPAAALLVAGRLLRKSDDERDTLPLLGLLPGVCLATLLVVRDVGTAFAHDQARWGLDADRIGFVAAACAAALCTLVAAFCVRPSRPLMQLVPLPPLLAALALAALAIRQPHQLDFTPLLSGSFAATLFVIFALIVVGRRLRGRVESLASLGAGLLLLALLTTDIHRWGQVAVPDVGSSRVDLRFAARVWISVAWGVYAAGLLVFGFKLRRAALRWSGLALFGLTVAKVFLVDLAELDTVWRVGSFLGLGLLLLAASFLYQRTRVDGDSGHGEGSGT